MVQLDEEILELHGFKKKLEVSYLTMGLPMSLVILFKSIMHQLACSTMIRAKVGKAITVDHIC